MTLADLYKALPSAQPVPPAVLWRGDGPLDPGLSIPQNRPGSTGFPGAVPVPLPAETAPVTAAKPSDATEDALSLTIWCPPAHQSRLESVLRPFADRLAPELRGGAKVASDAASDPGAFARQANAPGLVVFGSLSDHLAEALSVASGEEADAAPPLPRPVPEIVEEWCAQSEALLAAVRGAQGHITLIPALALLLCPEAAATALAEHYGLPSDHTETPPSEARLLPEDQPPHFALMAGAIAATSPRVGAVLEGLAKASLEVPGLNLRHPYGPAAQRRLLTEADALHRAERDSLRQSHDRDLRRVETLAEARMQRLRHQADAARLALLERDVLSARLSETAAQNDAAATYLREELTRREAGYAAQAAEVEVLRATSTQLEAARKAVSRKGNRLERDVEALVRNVQMRDERIACLAEALVSYEDEALALRDEVAALRSSTSWRLTAPVRGVSLLLRRLLRR